MSLDPIVPDMLAAALDAYDNGLCIVRAATDGTKRPIGQWLQYQTERPTRAEVEGWFRTGHAGMGVICGAVSGDLEMFELEGRFVDTIGTAAYKAAMVAAGLELLLARLTDSYMTISPSNGRHFLYRNAGAVDGNTKLARDPDNNTLIETRGEGGFVILPPSHGTVHPTGRAWRRKGSFSAIPTITSDERDAMFEVARSFDAAPLPTPAPPVAPAQRIRLPRFTGLRPESYHDAVEAHLEATTSPRDLLEHYGWTFCYIDKHNRTLMRRPGKDQGVSGSINTSNRLHPFSTSVPFAVGGRPAPTYNMLDIIAAYEYGNDRTRAAREIAERIGVFKAAPGNVDPTTGEITAPGLDEAFWTARESLTHIRTAARSRLVAPTAVLGAVLARVAAFTPPTSCLPPLIGTTAPLSLFVAFRGRSGAGKSSPAGAATDLLPETPPGCIGPLALGSGEGLVEAYMELVEEEGGDGKKRKVKKQIKHGALFMLDEGQMLAQISSRQGSTILSILRTAWSGGDPGQANASIETRRSLRAGSYALGLISLWQDRAAALLLADVDGGTPQRFVWLPTDDAGATVDHVPWPGPLDWTPPPMMDFGGALRVAQEIVDEVKSARVAELRCESETDALDAHRRLNKLKVAGVLCVLDNRRDVNLEDWALAESIMALSDQVRNWVLFEARRGQEEAITREAHRMVARESIVEKSAVDRALLAAAKATYRAVVKGDGEPVKIREIRHAISSRERKWVTADEAIDEAIRLRWIVGDADKGWLIGGAKPT